jgi:hypothetical protein
MSRNKRDCGEPALSGRWPADTPGTRVLVIVQQKGVRRADAIHDVHQEANDQDPGQKQTSPC